MYNVDPVNFCVALLKVRAPPRRGPSGPRAFDRRDDVRKTAAVGGSRRLERAESHFDVSKSLFGGDRFDIRSRGRTIGHRPRGRTKTLRAARPPRSDARATDAPADPDPTPPPAAPPAAHQGLARYAPDPTNPRTPRTLFHVFPNNATKTDRGMQSSISSVFRPRDSSPEGDRDSPRFFSPSPPPSRHVSSQSQTRSTRAAPAPSASSRGTR